MAVEIRTAKHPPQNEDYTVIKAGGVTVYFPGVVCPPGIADSVHVHIQTDGSVNVSLEYSAVGKKETT